MESVFYATFGKEDEFVFSRKISIILVMALCIALGASMSASAADYKVSVYYQWESSGILEQFTMDVTMTSSFTATVETDAGLTGELFALFFFVGWDLADTTFYRGILLGPLAFGDMENTANEKGSWFAIISPLGAAAEDGVMLGKP
jgi:hypothetical protein